MTTETIHEPRNAAITGGLTTGIIGTTLGALGIIGGGSALLHGNDQKETPKYVTKDEFAMGQQLSLKDAEIALLKAESNTEKKMVEVYSNLETQLNNVKDKIDANRDRADDRLTAAYDKLNTKIDANKAFQDGVNAQQMAYNGTNNATIACMQNQIADLKSVTKIVVPNSNVCPGWGPIEISPLSA